MSPSPAADSTASVSAWATTSPSECPAQPSTPGQSRPASRQARPGSIGWTSVPMPDPGQARAHRAHLQLGQREVVRRRSPWRPARRPRRWPPGRPPARTTAASSVSVGVGVERAGVGGDERGAVEALRGLHPAQRLARAAASVTTPSSSTATVVSTTGSTGTTARAPAASAASTRATTSGGVSGRAASCTRTTSAVARPRPRAPARTEAVRVAPPSTRTTSAGRTAANAARSVGRDGDHDLGHAAGAQGVDRPADERAGRPAAPAPSGRSAPRRRPLPAAATMPTACTGVVWVSRSGRSAALSWRGPRRGGSRPCPRWCPRRARAR